MKIGHVAAEALLQFAHCFINTKENIPPCTYAEWLFEGGKIEVPEDHCELLVTLIGAGYLRLIVLRTINVLQCRGVRHEYAFRNYEAGSHLLN